jgi:glycosyltransferase involved in cell wall biosynthesis
MSNQKVFMIGWEFPPHHSGGLGVACQGITRGLAALDQSLVFALPKVLASGSRTRRVNFVHPDGHGMEMVLINSALEPYVEATRWETETSLTPRINPNMIEEAKRYGEVVAKVARDYQPALIHAHDWMSIPAGIKTKAVTGKPLVLQIHSTDYDRSGGHDPSGPVAELEWQGMNAADRVIAVSEYTKHILMEKYSIPGEKIEVVHNGVDPNPDFHSLPIINFLQGKPLIIFVGRLTIQKGPEYFLAVAKQVIQQIPQAVFVLAGQGDMYQNLLVSAAYQQLSSSVLFAGFLREKESVQLYQRADVFVMPSVSEPFGIAALEAALANTPVIVSKSTGAIELLPHAYAIDFWDINKMAAQIVELIRNPQLRQERAAAVQREAQAATWEAAARKMQNLYQRLVS